MLNRLCNPMPYVSRFTFAFYYSLAQSDTLKGSHRRRWPSSRRTFQMGSDKGRPNETPVHQISLEAFYIDKYETTNADYRAFVLANPDGKSPSSRYETISDIGSEMTFPLVWIGIP